MEVVFFPKEQYPVSVCDHRHNKKMTCTFASDNHWIESYNYMCNLAQQKGLRLGVFYGRHAQGTMNQDNYAAIKQAEAADICRTDIYFPAPSGSSWNVRYTEQQYVDTVSLYKSWLYDIVGRIPSVFGYAYGVNSYTEFAKDYWLAGRDSEAYNQYNNNRQNYLNYSNKAFNGNYIGSPNIVYDRTKYYEDESISYEENAWISQPNTTRWDYFIKQNINGGMTISAAVADAVSKMSNLLDICYQQGGWFRDFVHWDDYYPQTGGWYKNFTEWTTAVDDIPFNPLDMMFTALFEMIEEKSYFDDIHFCSWGEAIEYMVARMMVKKISAYTPKSNPNAINIAVETDMTKYGNIAEMLNTPISIYLSLEDTPLENESIIVSNCVGYNQNGNDIVIEIDVKRCNVVSILQQN